MTPQHRVLVLHQVPHGGSPTEMSTAISDRVPDVHVETASDYDDSLRRIPDADIVVSRRLDDTLLDAAETLQWVQALSAGVGSYDLERLEREGIFLTNASGVHSVPLAEQVLGYLLAFERDILRGIQQQNRREWRHYQAGELRNKTVGIIGLGEIGQEIARLTSAVGMSVVGTKREPTQLPHVEEVYGPEKTSHMIGKADYVVLSCPLTPETRELIDADALASMKPNAVLVNVARGAVVDEKALITSLQKGQIGGAALDVQATEPLPSDSTLWDLSNVIVTPHMGGSTPRYWDRCGDIFADNYEHFRNGNDTELINRIV